MNLHDFRRQYQHGGLRRADLHKDPIEQFQQWFNEVLNSDVADPTAMVLATVNEQQQPRQRIVLLKKVDQQGFTFFTDKTSVKGRDIEHNQNVSLLFPWNLIDRQVIVSGRVEHVDQKESEDYFTSRPKESQWAAWASSQSQPIESRQQLETRFSSAQSQHPEQVPMPNYWGGYRVIPTSIEFWQGGEHRLHDRFSYAMDTTVDGWSVQRLSP